MKFLRLMALLEGLSLLALFFVAMPLKYMYGMPEAVKMAGPIHGWLFIAFNAVLFYFVYKGCLTEEQGFWGFLASLAPFGTFVYKARVLNKV
jgi:integral membrane protein